MRLSLNLCMFRFSQGSFGHPTNHCALISRFVMFLFRCRAFSKADQKQLWVPLVEKAYAKAHGCYNAISGGWICEGLFDLTAAPTETIRFGHATFDAEVFWARLLSFHAQDFLMGASCPQSGRGLVGMHAYSILDVRELTGVVVGRQTRIQDFFSANTPRAANSPGKTAATTPTSALPVPGMTPEGVLRLVRLRNPWGTREWVGEYGRKSEQWTSKLRKELGQGGATDGTFWMAYDDFLARFMDVDVCKAHRDWYAVNIPGSLSSVAPDGLAILAAGMVQVRVHEPTLLYVTAVQPNKRGKVQGTYWFSDVSMLIMKVTDKRCTVEQIRLCGARRNFHIEIMFDDPSAVYFIVPFSLGATTYVPHNRRSTTSASKPHRLSIRVFSAKSIASTVLQDTAVAAKLCRLGFARWLFPYASTGQGGCAAISRSQQVLPHTDGLCTLTVIEGTGTLVAVAANGLPQSRGIVLRLRLLLHRCGHAPNVTLCFHQYLHVQQHPDTTCNLSHCEVCSCCLCIVLQQSYLLASTE
eukprot:m.858982 g.858982  ORF g.858982 m.858982 type:complete len:526 (+) comp23526_c0_seq5:1852-3429(+)